MTVFILRSINTEEKPDEATSIWIFSTRDLALEFFADYISEYNGQLDADEVDEYGIGEATIDELRDDGSTEIFGPTVWDLTEYQVDSTQAI